jgi:hypothetical protein
MKILNFKYLVILVSAIALFNGCSSDETAVVSPYVGNYTISKATTATIFTVPTAQMGTIPIPAGQDITSAIQMALLSQVPCTTTSLVELRQDFTMYISCNKANPLNAGTWQEVSATEIKLNMNSAAIPSSPTGLPLTVTSVVKDATKLTGKTSVPLPKAMIAAMIAPMSLTMASTAPEVFQVEFNLEFTIKN